MQNRMSFVQEYEVQLKLDKRCFMNCENAKDDVIWGTRLHNKAQAFRQQQFFEDYWAPNVCAKIQTSFIWTIIMS